MADKVLANYQIISLGKNRNGLYTYNKEYDAFEWNGKSGRIGHYLYLLGLETGLRIRDVAKVTSIVIKRTQADKEDYDIVTTEVMRKHNLSSSHELYRKRGVTQ